MPYLIVERSNPLRRHVEERINLVYGNEYGAVVGNFPDTLIVSQGPDGEIASAAGVRFYNEKFFSEYYLSEAVENVLGRIWKRPVARDQVAEVTGLAGIRPGAAINLIRHIIQVCRKGGADWAFFTATDRLRAILHRTGVPTIDLAAASIDAVPNPRDWGSYYQTNPRVVAIHDSMILVDADSGMAMKKAAIA